jgi:serine/threonine protein phosphatase PrpC
MQMAIRVNGVAYQSETGRRANNEDMFALPKPCVPAPLTHERGWLIETSLADMRHKGQLFMVADGVGGHVGGEVASALAVAEVGQRYYLDPSADRELAMARVISAANGVIRQCGAGEGWQRMATTLTAVVILPSGKLIVAHVGDSRAYLIRHGRGQQLTLDHSYAAEQARHGQNSTNPSDQHRITRSLGSKPHVGADVTSLTLQAGDHILLCSDGLSSYVSDKQLAHIASQPQLQPSLNHLIDTAYDNGSPDNISALLLAVGEGSRAVFSIQ